MDGHGLIYPVASRDGPPFREWEIRVKTLVIKERQKQNHNFVQFISKYILITQICDTISLFLYLFSILYLFLFSQEYSAAPDLWQVYGYT